MQVKIIEHRQITLWTHKAPALASLAALENGGVTTITAFIRIFALWLHAVARQASPANIVGSVWSTGIKW